MKKKLSKQPLVTVSLLLWHSEKFITNCLESLFAQTFPDFELIIFNNNDVFDGGVEIAKDFIKRYGDEYKIKFVDNKKNIGFAPGHNLGINMARGDYVLLLNQDIELAPDFLEKAIAVLQKNKKYYGVQSRCLRLKMSDNGAFEKTNIIDSAGLLMLKNRRIICRGQGQPADGVFLNQERIFGIDGAVPLFRKTALDEIRLCFGKRCEYLDEDFMSYKEDVDLSWRFLLYGWQAVYCPEVIAWHVRGSGDSARRDPIGIIKERKKINDFSKKLSFKNQRLMQTKNEVLSALILHFPWFLPKEILSWLYFLIFEWRNREAIKILFRSLPLMLKKRRIIMSNRKIKTSQLIKWFD